MPNRIAAALALAFALAAGAGAQDAKAPLPIEVPKRDKPVDFRTDLLPFLKTNCISCHNAKDHEGELSLETPKAILKGGGEGPAVVPGNSAKSLLLTSAAHQAKPIMPPKKNKVGAVPLTPGQLGLIKLWIDQGAKESTGSAELDAPRWQPVTSAWNPIYAVGLDADGQFAACGRAGHLFVYHVPTGRLIDQPADPRLASLVPPGKAPLADRDAVLSLAFSPDGTLLATGGYRSIRLWKKDLPEKKGKIELPADVKAIALSRDGAKLAVAGADHVVRLFDLGGAPALELNGHTDAVASLRFSADGALLLSGSLDKTLRVWKCADGSPVGQIDAPAALGAVELSLDGKQVAGSSADGMLRLWPMPDAATKPAPLKEIKAPAAIELRSTAAGLLAASADGKIALWNPETGKAVRELAHGGPLSSLAVSPDGKRWLSIGGAGAGLWNAEDGKKIADLKADGPAARRDRAAQAILAFAGSEVAYRQNAVKALEDQKKKEEAEVAKAAEAVAPSEKALKDKDDALAKARGEREAADKAIAEAGLAVETAKERFELALNALGITDPEQALAQAEAESAASIQYLEDAKKNPQMVVDAKMRAETSTRLLAFGRTGLGLERAKAEKAAADQKLADATAAKAAADAAKKTVDETRKKMESVTIEADRKLAEESLKKLEGELAAALEHAKKFEGAKAAPAPAAAQAAFDAAKKALADAKTAAEAGIKAAETQRTAAGPKQAAAKKAEDAALNAVEIAKANLDSAKGRVEKSKEAVAANEKAIQEANARVEAQKAEQARLDGERKQAAEALAKAKLPLRSGGFSAEGSLVLLGGEDGRLYTFGAERGADSAIFDAHAKPVLVAGGPGVSVAADGSTRAAALLPTWKLQRTIESAEADKAPIDRVLALGFSPDGKLLASGGGVPSRDGELVLWNTADGSIAKEIASPHSDTVFDVSFSPDGTMLASAGADKFARVFDAKSGKQIRAFEGHTNHVLGVAWSRTGRTLTTSGADDVVKIWSLESGQQLKTVPGFPKQATAVRYVGYESTFAVAAGGTPVRLVREDGNVVKNFESAGAFMYDLALSGDGQILAAGGLDGVLRLWTVADGKSFGTFAPPGLPAPAPKQ